MFSTMAPALLVFVMQVVVATASTGVTFKTLEWNVYYRNTNVQLLAASIMANNPQPDVIGLCELTTPVQDMANALTGAAGRAYAAQPGREVWQGYGTDIFYDAGRWEALEGGAVTAPCSSWGGPRASNWVVLRERLSGKILVTGGTHLSYCAGGCDAVQQCELRSLYSHLEAMKNKYPGSAVVWMGDMNQPKTTPMLNGAMQGDLGGYQGFPLDDVVETNQNTYMSGGPAIDYIFAERGSFQVKSSGTTGQGVTGQTLAGADHFPVYSVLTFAA
mmetsp:Transcript_73205/g.152786  ORF Transcript_73205/g.152786 Transcript_73205/m.152786 type:complete len:274 (-) Transcript_73205:725-1546(-)